MLERSGCCENGINPKAVYDFIISCEKNNIGIDSFMLLKNGKVVSEAYYPPYTRETTHILYSMSKSFTATALGFAIAEGKVSLEDSVSDFFPEYDPKGRSKSVKVRHLVTMTADKMVGMAKARHDKDWIKIFFDAPLIAKPGSFFIYTNDNFYMLSAIVSKVYGETLADFLYPRLFEPLGIEKPVWEVDKFGYAAGGWGLYLPIEAQAKVILCYANGGMYDGKQVIPAEWVQEATKYQVPTVKHGQIDVTKGYGYGFWRSSLPDKDTLPAQARNYRLEEELCAADFSTRSTSFGSMLHATMTTVMNDRIGKINRFRLSKEENGDMFLSWTEGAYTNRIKLGLDDRYERTEITLANIKYHANAKAAWTSGKVFTVYIRVEEGCHLRVLEFDLSGKKPVVRNNSYPDMPNLAAYYLDFSGFPLPSPLEKALINYVAPAVMLIGEPNFRLKQDK